LQMMWDDTSNQDMCKVFLDELILPLTSFLQDFLEGKQQLQYEIKRDYNG